MSFNGSTDLYEATIPGQTGETLVKYAISAFDNAENQATDNNAGQYYIYNIVPDFAGLLFLPFLMSATLLGLALRKRQKNC